jgi:hypothetical protein
MPNRILKESICTSDSIDQLSAFEETLFYRLIVNCDDYGRFDGRPKIIASKLYPLKDIRSNQIESALRALTSAELVILYEVDGKPFLQMKTWDRHQQIRAKKSKYPSPESGNITPDGVCNQMISNDIKCPRNPIQSESNPNPIQKSSARTASRFTPPTIEEVDAYCKERGNRINPQTFVDFYEAKGWKVGNNPMKDWKACIRTWEQRDGQRGGSVQKPKVLRAQDYEQREYHEEDMKKILGVDDLFVSDEEYFRRYGKHSPYRSEGEAS